MATEAKSFPGNYSDRVLDIVKALSMSGLKGVAVLGSYSIRSQIYAGDIDLQNTVSMPSVEAVAAELREIVKRLQFLETYIGDVKCGEIREWNPFRPNAIIQDKKITNFNIKESQSIIAAIPATAISPAERKRALELLEKATDPYGFLEAKKEIRYHILRWKPAQLLEGAMIYRGLRITLVDAIKTKGMIKIDVVADIDRFTEMSMIYNISIKGTLITAKPPNLILSIAEDVSYYNKKNPFKAVKRLFSLAKATGNKKGADALIPILNSDLGRLYQIVGDLEVLKGLSEQPSPPWIDIRAQLDEIKARMGNIYTLRDFLREEHDIIGEINAVLKTQPTVIGAKLVKLISRLSGILDRATVKAFEVVSKNEIGME